MKKKKIAPLKLVCIKAEYDKIMKTLALCRGRKSKCAAALGIDRKTLYNKINAYEKYFKS